MKAASAWLLGLAGLSGAVAAEEQPLICFGNEPSWSVHLTEPGVARFATPDSESVTYRGASTRNDLDAGETPAPPGDPTVAWPSRLHVIASPAGAKQSPASCPCR